MSAKSPTRPLNSVGKFYFLDYFYVLLKSLERHSEKQAVFEAFKVLKLQHRLGESKYKTLSQDGECLTDAQVQRYWYTFGMVTKEATDYELVNEPDSHTILLTPAGRKLVALYEDDRVQDYNRAILQLMESRYQAYGYLVEFLYQANKHDAGLLILPNYSPRLLGMERSLVRRAQDVIQYSELLVRRLRQDISDYLHQERDLSNKNLELLGGLRASDLLPPNPADPIRQADYNKITKRFRDFWISYFLKDIYGYNYSTSSFDVWTYRGKQIGVIQATEFYPSFSGRIVYPTAVVISDTRSGDFEDLYRYRDGDALFVHRPRVMASQDRFIDALTKAYFALRRTNRSYFVNLLALREIVCYNMKISDSVFQELLEQAYRLNLAGQLGIRFSLEVDRLPEETKAMYLKREPVMVDGRYRNIIALDVTKAGQSA